ATITNAIVFLPILFVDFEQAAFRALLGVLALAILLPLAGSVLVAVGLVPLLARRLAAPAAMARVARMRREREELGGLVAPDRARELFGALLTVALRRPGGWVTSVTVAVLITVVFALPFVAFSSLNQEPPEPERLTFPVQFDAEESIEASVVAFERLEQEALALPGIEHVESFIQGQGGSFIVKIPPKDSRPADLSVGRVRSVINEVADQLGIDVSTTQSQDGDGLAGLLGQGASTVVISGP
ncbi:MAG: hypothetical protein GY716_21270, partial [bacterium]|nr:hypothetical protein [bacterium]